MPGPGRRKRLLPDARGEVSKKIFIATKKLFKRIKKNANYLIKKTIHHKASLGWASDLLAFGFVFKLFCQARRAI